MDKKTIYIILALVVAAVVYMKFFHKKKGAHPALHAAGGTPAVKKKGGGGWRHRLSHIAHMVPGVSQAEKAAKGYVSAQTGGLLNL